MNTHTLDSRPAPRFRLTRPRLWLAAGAVVVLGAAAGIGTLNYLGRGPSPIEVTNTSGAATFNFRVTGIPVPGKIEGVTPHLTFSPSNLSAARGTVTLGLTHLNTGIALRDMHAREFLGVEKHPVATFNLQKLNVAGKIAPGQTLRGTADGTLNLNGVSVPLQSPITLTEAADGSVIDVSTGFDVTFARHHISIPGADPRTDVKVVFRLPLRQ
ncbi:YceI family protein (plasmid) [Deinococcus sp. KNUC1210]|uniref:YceI family protein n=1 Tax=Deinococcus sp. KNUC1210 TaxID=2917691 RepID=UPI001EF01CD4|nr:YceI family protein [Deinococcus sp. KNUC1210]ULH17224.1 YceI family protein [Deinococcus sp. KNUC1210]